MSKIGYLPMRLDYTRTPFLSRILLYSCIFLLTYCAQWTDNIISSCTRTSLDRYAQSIIAGIDIGDKQVGTRQSNRIRSHGIWSKRGSSVTLPTSDDDNGRDIRRQNTTLTCSHKRALYSVYVCIDDDTLTAGESRLLPRPRPPPSLPARRHRPSIHL